MVTEEDERAKINLLVMQDSALEDGLFMITGHTLVEPIVSTRPKEVATFINS